MFSRFKGRKNEIDEDDFDLLDSDDFDDFPDWDDSEGAREPSKKQLAKVAAKSVAKGTKDKIRDETVKNLIPGDYDSNVLEVKDVANHTKDLIRASAEDITNTLSKVIPKSLSDKLGIGSKGDVYQQVSEEEKRTAEIASTLDSIFTQQQSHQERLEQTERDSRNTTIEISKLADSRLQTDVLAGMSNDISRLTGFFTTIGSSYYRKSLEMQFKSYNVQLDSYRTQLNYSKSMSQQLDGLLKNTSLPEHVKITQSERFDNLVRESIASGLYARMYTNNEFIQNIKKNIESRIKDTTSMVRDSIEGIGSVFEIGSDMGISGKETAANLGGGVLGGWLGGKINKRLQPRLKEQLGDNEVLQGLGYTLENAVKGSSSLAQSTREAIARNLEAAEGTDGIRGKVSRGVLRAAQSVMGLTEQGARDKGFKKESIKDFNAPAIFDNNIYRSIANAIPTYLSHILAKTTDISELYQIVNSKIIGNRFKPNEPLVFNYMTKRLGSVSDLRTSINMDLTGRDGKPMARGVDNIVSTSLNALNKDKKGNVTRIGALKSKRNTDALKKYVTTMGIKEGIDGDYDTLFTNALGDNANSEIRAYLNDNPEVKRAVEAIVEGQKQSDVTVASNTRDTFNIHGKNSMNAYPIASVDSLFVNISKLSRPNSIPNTLTDDQAYVIAKAWSEIIFDDNKDVLATEDSMIALFAKIRTKKERDLVLDEFRLFMNDVMLIESAGTYVEKQKALSYFAVVNLSIREKDIVAGSGRDGLKDVFQMLKSIHPDLMPDQNELTASNIMGEGLSVGRDTSESLDTSEIRNLLNVDSSLIAKTEDKLGNSRLFKGLERLGNEFKEAASTGEGILGKSIAVFDLAASKTKDMLNVQYGKLTDNLERLGSAAEKLTIETIDKGINTLAKHVNNTGNDLKELIDKEEEDYRETVNSLNTLINNVRSTNPEEAEELIEELEELKVNREKRIAGYDLLKNSLDDLKGSLVTLSEGESTTGERAMDKTKALYSTIMNKIGEMKEVLNVFNKEKI